MMLKYKIIIIFLVSVLILTHANALTTNGSGNTFSYTITSNTNNNPSSENFKNYLVVGSINEDMSSSNFKTRTGFSITAPFLDGEACEVDSECVGGFCCSSSCQSTSCPVAEEEAAAGAAAAAGGGGGGGTGAGLITEPDVQFDVKILEFDALGGKFIDQLFDITFSLEDSIINSSDELEAIVTFESFGIRPVRIKLGDFFNFTYFLRGVGDINNDVTIDFKIEQNGEVITTGSDMIYMGSFEEKTETARLFLPNNLTSGKYRFIVRVNHENYTAESQRTIDLIVSGGEVIIIPAVDLTFIILDKNGNEIYREKDSITVETEKVLRKSFKGLNLPDGKYIIILQTLYNVDVFDEFRQNFEIRKEITPQPLISYLKKYWILLLALAMIFLLFMILKKKRKKEDIQIIKKKKIEDKKEKINFNFFSRIGLVKTEKEEKEIARKKEQERKRKELERKKMDEEQRRITEEMEKRRLQTLKRIETEKEKQKEFELKRKQRDKIKEDIFTLFHDLGLVKTKEEKEQIRKRKEEERKRKEKLEEKRTKQREKAQKLMELERKRIELKKEENKIQKEIEKIKEEDKESN